MRQVLLCCALFLAGCGTYISTVGPYRARLSPADVQAITQIAQSIYPGHYNQMTLNAVRPDEVWVDTLAHAGTGSYDYSAIRRHGRWESSRHTPPPPMDN